MARKKQEFVLRFGGRMLLALLPTLMLGAYARQPGWAFLQYFSLVPWVVLYTDDRQPRVSWLYYFLGAYLSWIVLHTPFFNFGWWVPFAMGAFFFPPYLLFAPLLRRIHQRFRWPRTLTVPLIWVGVEWIRATFTLAHFDIFHLGYSQGRFPILIQIADITGVYGVSFLVAAVNGLLADFYFALRDTGWSPARGLRTRRVVVSAVAVAAGFALVSAYGVYRLSRATNIEGPRLALVQPNERHSHNRVAGVHLGQVLLTDREVRSSEADLIVWPENAILDDLTREKAYLDDLGWLARRKDALLLVGAMGRSPTELGAGTNAAFLVDDRGAILGSYDKQVLFPWSEYVPWDGLLERIAPPFHRLHRMISRRAWGYLALGVPGRDMKLFSLPWREQDLRFATLICGENIYPPMAAEASRQGAQFLVHITSEGLVGGPVQEQLLRVCILRAVENRLPFVRCCNTGISCFIDSEGRVKSVLRGKGGRTINVAGVLVDSLALRPGPRTWYARSRDTFGKACVLGTLILFLWSWRRPASV